jgi:hypothetical protein
MSETSNLILSVLDDIEPLMQAAFAAVGGSPEQGSALDQVFLLDGRVVVVDYLAHGEPALAVEHLIYMIKEPPLRIGDASVRRLAEAARTVGLPDAAWKDIVRK